MNTKLNLHTALYLLLGTNKPTTFDVNWDYFGVWFDFAYQNRVYRIFKGDDEGFSLQVYGYVDPLIKKIPPEDMTMVVERII